MVPNYNVITNQIGDPYTLLDTILQVYLGFHLVGYMVSNYSITFLVYCLIKIILFLVV